MKNNQQLLNEKTMLFFKYLDKRSEGAYALIDRENRQRKSALWCKYLDKRMEEIENKIKFNDEILAMNFYRN